MKRRGKPANIQKGSVNPDQKVYNAESATRI